MAGSKSLDGQMLAEAIDLEDPEEALDMVRSLLGSGTGPGARGWENTDPLTQAAWAGRWEIVRVLLEAGANRPTDMRWGSDDPLLTVALGGSADLIETLLERCGGWECMVELRQGDPFVQENPIEHLVQRGSFDQLERLWKLGLDSLLDVFSSDLAWTPLMDASNRGDLDGVHWLLARGADVNARADSAIGGTALELTVRNFDVAMTRWLLGAGANPSIPTWMWKTAVEQAISEANELRRNDKNYPNAIAIRDELLSASAKYAPPVYPDGTSPAVWPPKV